MKRFFESEFFYGLIGVLLFCALFVFMLWYGTSKESWYADMHDNQCELENCKCYERFMERE